MTEETTALLVDDDELLLQELAIFLRRRGINYATATNGQEALEKVQRLKPDVVVMDIRMPVMNGLDAFAEIRKLSGEQPVVILMSGDCTGLREARETDCAAVLEKPFSLASLDKLIARHRTTA